MSIISPSRRRERTVWSPSILKFSLGRNLLIALKLITGRNFPIPDPFFTRKGVEMKCCGQGSCNCALSNERPNFLSHYSDRPPLVDYRWSRTPLTWGSENGYFVPRNSLKDQFVRRNKVLICQGSSKSVCRLIFRE